MSSSIQFRFSSSKTYEAVTFSGLMIKLLELKRAIVEKRNLDKGTSDFDLRISNAQTDEVYESDDVMVPKNTSVVVRRVPCTAETGLLAKLEGGARISTRAARAIEVQARPQKVETAAVLNSVGDTLKEFTPAVPQGRGRGRGGPGGPGGFLATHPPGSYVCHRCGKPGHFIRECPENGNAAFDNAPRVRHGVPGMPRTFWKAVAEDAIDDGGSTLARTPEGTVVAIVPQEEQFRRLQGRMGGNTAAQLSEDDKRRMVSEAPSHYVCRCCRGLLRDAVLLPCCGESACDGCARRHIAESGGRCPLCRAASPADRLVANRSLRAAVATYQAEWGKRERDNLAQQRDLALIQQQTQSDALAPRQVSGVDAELDLGGAAAPPPAPSAAADDDDDFGGDVFNPAAPTPAPEAPAQRRPRRRRPRRRPRPRPRRRRPRRRRRRRRRASPPAVPQYGGAPYGYPPNGWPPRARAAAPGRGPPRGPPAGLRPGALGPAGGHALRPAAHGLRPVRRAAPDVRPALGRAARRVPAAGLPRRGAARRGAGAGSFEGAVAVARPPAARRRRDSSSSSDGSRSRSRDRKPGGGLAAQAAAAAKSAGGGTVEVDVTKPSSKRRKRGGRKNRGRRRKGSG